LECLIKCPILGIPADKDAAKAEEWLINIRLAFIADGESPEAIELGEGPLYNPFS
jgi:hypothetical protein